LVTSSTDQATITNLVIAALYFLEAYTGGQNLIGAAFITKAIVAISGAKGFESSQGDR
jgi:hypothetical protein